MKYLVVKGWLGFGDRLESLKMCVLFAQQNNLKIYVDWTDPIWTHGDESFYTYFKLVNMHILNSLDDIPADATYFPTYWKGKIKTSLTQDIVTKGNELGISFELNTANKSADVIVFSCIRKRTVYADSGFFAKSFRLVDQKVRSSIQQRLMAAPLSTCIGIHARGTDRAKHVIRKEHSIQFMAIAAMPFSSKKMITVGDDAYSIEVWKRFYPQTIVFGNPSTTTNKGNHNATKDEISVSKYDLTVEALTDFFTLAHCEKVISTFRDSRFAQEARRLHPYIKQILGNE
jgi:hypothetical protein